MLRTRSTPTFLSTKYMVKYRKAHINDATELFELKNDETVRANSILTHEKIEWKSHVDWLTNKLKDPEVEIWIIENEEDEMIGDVRIDHLEISIKLFPQFRGKGIGGEAIKHFARKGLIAKIVEGNVPSMRIFVDAGFNFIDYQKGCYTLCKK